MNFAGTAGFLPDNFTNKAFRRFDVVPVGLIAKHSKEFIICRDNCTFCKMRKHILTDIGNVHTDRLPANGRHPRRNIKTDFIHLLNEPVQPSDDDIDCAVKQIDYGVPYTLENVLNSFPRLVKIHRENAGDKLD